VQCNSDVCLVSLAHHVPVTNTSFAGVAEGNELCKGHLHETASLAVLTTSNLAELAGKLVEELHLPHFIHARKHGTGKPEIAWGGEERRDEWERDGWEREYPWHTASGQPNDCDGAGSEPCVFVGPGGRWFDFACGPKTADGTTPGPEITWGEERSMFQIHPLCIVKAGRVAAKQEGGGRDEL